MKKTTFLIIFSLIFFFSSPLVKAQESGSIINLSIVRSSYGGGRLYAPMLIGQFQGKMRVDTGASSSRVSPAPWNKDAPIIGSSRSLGVSGKFARCDDVRLPKITMKSAAGPDVGRVNYLVTRCAGEQEDDLLGLDFFRGGYFVVDSKRHQIQFLSGPSAKTPQYFLKPLGAEKKLMAIDIKIGDLNREGLIDSGAQISAVDRRFVDAHPELFVFVKSGARASDASGKPLMTKIYKVKLLDLGDGRIIRGLYVLVYDFALLREEIGEQAHFILGFNLIDKFNWRFDLRTNMPPRWEAMPR